MHKHIDWDAPGNASVTRHYASDKQHEVQPHPGMMLSARYQGMVVRVEVEAYREDDALSIGKVAALIDTQGKRHQSHSDLSVGDYVRLPDDKRALEPTIEDEED
ncbi:hypothetical protein HLV40_04760 [Chromohalobacter salexigens]|nr:hypothetical protein [Chromohalobacter salexigens]CDQ34163.1 hypothetical protein BN993_03617 [Virgibacillus halodenitrificans]